MKLQAQLKVFNLLLVAETPDEDSLVLNISSQKKMKKRRKKDQDEEKVVVVKKKKKINSNVS